MNIKTIAVVAMLPRESRQKISAGEEATRVKNQAKTEIGKNTSFLAFVSRRVGGTNYSSH
jgi:hypothetical protein